MNYRELPCYRILLIGLFSMTLPLVGCAGRKTTTVSTTEVRNDASYGDETSYYNRPTVEVTKREEVTQDDGHKGFFGILGDIIALPFRAVGSIL